jgi:tRNA-2-methylthio-N6-dimethylallyladenosine synthase
MGKKTLIKNLPDLNKARVRNAGFNIEYDNIVPSSFLIEKLKGKNYFIRTYGCQANVRDEETMSGMLDLVGMNKVDDEKEADVIIINTCAVRENAEDKVFGEIGNLKALKQKRNPLIMVCGCMVLQSHIVDKLLNIYKQVDVIFGTHNINALLDLIEEALRKNVHLVDVPSSSGNVHEIKEARRLDSYKAFINIMYGCIKFCTYCIVPYTRGKQRSREPKYILEEVKKLVEDGYKEVTLLGQNVNAYGKDLGISYGMAELLRDVAETGIDRVRFVTSHPWDFNDEMIDIIAKYDNIMPYIHLPLQSGSSRILKLMGRRYTKEEYITLFNKLKSKIKNVAITTDIIVAFPGETEEDFNETLEVVEKCKYDSAFTFIFSPRIGTPAAKMEDNLSQEEKNNRLYKLNDLVNKYAKEANLKYQDQVVKVLLEGTSEKDENMLMGYTETMKLVNVKADKKYIGQIKDVKITDVKTWSMDGELID